MSNNPLLVTLHHRLSADKLYGSEKKYYLLRKEGEKQTLLEENKDAKGKWYWIDAEELARCIAAVIRQQPDISQQGPNKLFGEYFKRIFPSVTDPSHSRCKYAWWLTEMVVQSYDSKARWKGVDDPLIDRQKDFKGLSEWTVSTLIDYFLREHFQFNEINEKRFVEKCEKWCYHSKQLKDFEKITNDMIDDAFRLLHAVSRTLLRKLLPKAREPYTTYNNLFKGPGYEYILTKIRKGKMITYKNRLESSMRIFVNYLKEN